MKLDYDTPLLYLNTQVRETKFIISTFDLTFYMLNMHNILDLHTSYNNFT